MSQPDIPQFLAGDLARVEAIIQQRIEAQDAVARAAGAYTGAGSEPRLHATLTLLAARLGPATDERVLHAAAAVELIHLATSVHNTLIDAAAVRRGERVDHNRWRGDVSLMVGDYMFALAASEMALAPDPRIIEYFSAAVMAISEAELMPVTAPMPLDMAVHQYMAAIGGTTAALFEAACKAGMVCGNGTPAQIEALGQFGHQVGLAYQINADNVALAANLRAGRITLPLIYAVEAGERDLAHFLESSQRSDDDIQRVSHAIGASGGTRRAHANARQASEAAARALGMFAASEPKQALLALAAFLA